MYIVCALGSIGEAAPALGAAHLFGLLGFLVMIASLACPQNSEQLASGGWRCRLAGSYACAARRPLLFNDRHGQISNARIRQQLIPAQGGGLALQAGHVHHCLGDRRGPRSCASGSAWCSSCTWDCRNSAGPGSGGSGQRGSRGRQRRSRKSHHWLLQHFRRGSMGQQGCLPGSQTSLNAAQNTWVRRQHHLHVVGVEVLLLPQQLPLLPPLLHVLLHRLLL